MNPEELKKLLTSAEPDLPIVNRNKLVAVLARPRLNREKPVKRSASIVALSISVISVLTCLFAVSLFDVAPVITPEEQLAAYERLTGRIELLEREFTKLNSGPVDDRYAIGPSLRASESLWMVIKSAEPPHQSRHAATIVGVFPSSLAAQKCRDEFPELVQQ